MTPTGAGDGRLPVIRGMTAARIERPADRAGLSQLLAETTGALVPVDGWRECGPGGALDAGQFLAVDLRGLDRVVDWQPDDLTVTVEPGLELGALEERLATRGQWLPLGNGGGSDRRTVGHLAAAAAPGPLAGRWGTARRHLIGLSVIDGRGCETRAGGRLVKNVAGYDLMKLHCGARDTLGIITLMTFRLQPLPEARVTLRAERVEPAGAVRFSRRLLREGLEPELLAIRERPAGGSVVTLRLAGFREDLATQAMRVMELAREERCSFDRHDWSGPLDPAPAETAVEPGWDLFRVEAEPARLPGLLAELSAFLLPRLPDLLEIEWHPVRGSATLAGHSSPATEAAGGAGSGESGGLLADQALAAAHGIARAHGGRLMVAGAPPGAGAWLDRLSHEQLWGASPPHLPLMRRMKQALDPERRFNPGRFFWGL